MVQYDIRTLQLHLLGMMKEFDAICKAHGLTYYLIAGTMLGAVRHKGFIPWDDDMDIAMPRPDYDRLTQNANEWLKDTRLEFANYVTFDHYFGAEGKLQDKNTTIIERAHIKFIGGAYIDVFPLDGVPENKIMQRLHFWHYYYYRRMVYFLVRDPYKHGRGPKAWPYLLLRKIYTLKQVQHKLTTILRKYPFETCKYTGDYGDGWRSIMPKAYIGTPTPVQFEDAVFMGVEKPDAYLTKVYGDYMTIPSQSEQQQHCFHILDLNTPYKNYKRSDE